MSEPFRLRFVVSTPSRTILLVLWVMCSALALISTSQRERSLSKDQFIQDNIGQIRRIAEAAKNIVLVEGFVDAEIEESLCLCVEALDNFHGKVTAFGPG